MIIKNLNYYYDDDEEEENTQIHIQIQTDRQYSNNDTDKTTTSTLHTHTQTNERTGRTAERRKLIDGGRTEEERDELFMILQPIYSQHVPLLLPLV